MIVPGEDLDHVPGREGNVQEEANLADQVLLLGNLQPEVRLQIRESWSHPAPLSFLKLGS